MPFSFIGFNEKPKENSPYGVGKAEYKASSTSSFSEIHNLLSLLKLIISSSLAEQESKGYVNKIKSQYPA